MKTHEYKEGQYNNIVKEPDWIKGKRLFEVGEPLVSVKTYYQRLGWMWGHYNKHGSKNVI